MKRTKISI